MSSPPQDGRPETEEPMARAQSADNDHRVVARSLATLRFCALKARLSSAAKRKDDFRAEVRRAIGEAFQDLLASNLEPASPTAAFDAR